MNYSYLKIGGAAALFIMLVVFTSLGFIAMKPGASQRNIDAFWLCILAFLAMLALYIFVFISPLLAIAPLFPLILFTRMFLATRKKDQ
ncbi:MAG: hypothetical protein J6M06_02810 [Synergistaceae bacterium]|nr:hypothetical protein [Synergistaceae bacterium]MBP3835578.1 hypothetical protein [Pyramidobacter sp.]